MGNRIHKALGYGGYHENNIKLFEHLDEHGVDGEVDQLLTSHLADNNHELFLETAELVEKYNGTYPKQFLECVWHCAYELDDEGPTIIIPPRHVDKWYRYDDIIDYFDADHTDPQITVKILDTPIYPYNDWMDPITLEKISTNEYHDGRRFIEPLPSPGIPLSVRLIADKIGMDWKSLTPMIVTWWG